MPRTTLDIDPEVLRELKRRRAAEHKPLGVIASELLARAIAEDVTRPLDFVWKSAGMGAKLDLDDKEALRQAMDAK